MTQSDLIADVLAELERPAMPREAFATTLLDELLPALDTGVAAPSGSSRSSRSTWRRWRFAALAAALLVFVTGVAAATYLVSRDSSPARARGVLNGPLTLLAFDRVLAVGLDGRRHTVWRCPSRHCGLTSFAWSRDGQRLAVAVAFFRRAAAGEGLYVVDAHGHVLVHVGREQLGCREQHDLAWSPDGRTIAYACASRMLYLIGADGTNARSFRAGLAGRHSSPTWSANGRYVAFAVRSPIGTSSVYTSNPTGGQLRLVARGGTGPAWSPDGTTIAYRAGCGGIKLVTPSGRDVTPHRTTFAGDLRCRAIGVPGLPSWAPEGNKIAISAPPRRGTYVINPNGTNLLHVSTEPSAGVWGRGRPSWQPLAPDPNRPNRSYTGL